MVFGKWKAYHEYRPARGLAQRKYQRFPMDS